ncbi:MAG: hypothetical protein CBD49_00945 [Acidimicrobiaceae bacterium TMED189]|nr:MAG: hypothetical protein CBD49_00945 [Acidimicrobiaceae bacterium TMED189]
MKWIILWLLIDAGSAQVDYPPQQEVVQAAAIYPWDQVRSLSIAWCESYHSPTAVNSKSDDHGAWQVSRPYWEEIFRGRTWDRRYTAEGSAAMAWHIFSWGEKRFGDGWQLWTCGRYK